MSKAFSEVVDREVFLDACRVVYQRECFIVSKLEEDLKAIKSHKDDLELFIKKWSEAFE